MIATAIAFILQNVPAVLFLAALVIAALRRPHRRSRAEHYLKWLLLLSIGVQSLWAGLFHVFAPATAAAFIGWQVSPFQYEIGIADIALGIVAVLSFWRSLEYKSVVVTFTVLFFAGLAAGHIRQIIATNNFSPGNGGVLLALTIVNAVLLVVLLRAARSSNAM